MGIALLFQLLDGGCRSAAPDFDAVLFHQSHVLVDGLVGDAERGNDIARHAAELFFTLENGRFHTSSSKEVGRRNTGRAAADDGGLLALQACRTADGGHQCAVALFRCDQLGVADLDGLFIEVAGAAVLAAVCADGAGDERQSVLLGDELQRRAVKALAAKLNVLRDILMDGATALARSREAVDQRDAFRALAGGNGLDGLEMVDIGVRRGAHIRDGCGIRTGKRAVGKRLDLFDHLRKAVVAAGLENGGGDGDGPDPGCEQLIAVEEFGAAREGNAHFALELTGNAIAHLNGQREQAAAGHVHLVSGQLAARGIDREGVRQLEAEFQPLRGRQRLKPFEHRNGVSPLEILVEMMLVKDDVAVAHRVENAAGGLVAENGRIALDEGVQALFRQKV